jgi:signal transduction histidine kinase
VLNSKLPPRITGNGAHGTDAPGSSRTAGCATGQGLSLARRIVEQHGGSITFSSALGEGTTFHVRLPIDATAAAAA